MKDLPYLLTVPQVAEILQISERRTYDLVRREGLRVKISEKRVRIPRDKLFSWIDEQFEGGERGKETAESTTAPSTPN